MLRQTLYNKHKHNTILLLFRGNHIILSATNLAILVAHTLGVFFCVGVLVPVTLQHVTMLTALAYQPHHPWGTSTETSS